MKKTQSTKAILSSKLSVLEEIFINEKGFCTHVQECGVNLETARLKSLRKGQVLRPLIPNLLLVRKCWYQGLIQQEKNNFLCR